MITTIIILSVLLTVSIAVNINQLRKQESQSDYITDLENSNTEYYNFFQKLKTQIGQSNSKLKQIEGLKIYGESKNKTSVISFNIEGIHSYDIGALLDKFGIAVRTGQHCAQPIMHKIGKSSTARVSFYLYNDFGEIDYLCETIKKTISIFK